MSARTTIPPEVMKAADRAYRVAYYVRDRWKATALTSEAIYGARMMRDPSAYVGRGRNPKLPLHLRAMNEACYQHNGIRRANGSTYALVTLPEDAPGWPIYRAAVLSRQATQPIRRVSDLPIDELMRLANPETGRVRKPRKEPRQ